MSCKEHPIPFAPGYTATSTGLIWSTKYKTKRRLKPWSNSYGHLFVDLRIDGRYKHLAVHRIVALVFNGPATGPVVRHLDGNPANNDASNLAWGTPADNSADMVTHGRSQAGVKMHMSKLTDEAVVAMRQRMRNGEQATVLAAEHGVSVAAVCHAVRGSTWRHVKEPTVRSSRPSLTAADVIEMRKRHRDGETTSQLAARYGITQWSVTRIIQRKRWKNVNGEVNV